MKGRKLVIVGAALLFGIFAIIHSQGCSGSGPSQPVAQVKNPQGTVDSRAGEAGDFSPAKDKQALEKGGAVRTGRKSTVDLVFADGSDCTVKAEAYFEVGKKEVTGLQNQGMVIYRFKTQQEGKKATVQTPHGVTAVLGTVFLLDVVSTSTTLLVDKGKVSFQPAGASEAVIVTDGQRLVCAAGQPPSQPEAVDPVQRKSMFEGTNPQDLGINK